MQDERNAIISGTSLFLFLVLRRLIDIQVHEICIKNEEFCI